MRLSVAIQAHPDRADLVADLLDSLDGPAPVAWDDEGPPNGNTDRGWRTARAAWERCDPDADWHLVLQDDAVLCGHLLAGLERALDHVPTGAVVSPYLGTGATAGVRWDHITGAAQRSRARWIRSTKLLGGVAIILPVHLIGEMVAYADRRTGVPDDMRVAGWAEKRGVEVWYTWPSLVDHLGVPSLTKHRAKDRRAFRFHTGSALELNWSGPVLDDPVFARRRAPRSGPSVNRQVASLSRRMSTGEAGKSA